jgi:hypothetical protein
MNDTRHENYIHHSDIVNKCMFYLVNLLANGIAERYASSNHATAFGIHYAMLFNSAFLFAFLCYCRKTAFSHDVKEIAIFDFTFKMAFFLSGALGFSVYHFFTAYKVHYDYALFLIISARFLWSFYDSKTDSFYNWPTFGIIGAYYQFKDQTFDILKPTKRQTIFAVFLFLAIPVASYFLAIYKVKNLDIAASVLILFAVINMVSRANRIYVRKLVSTSSQRMKLAWERYHARQTTAEKEKATRARIAAEEAAALALQLAEQQRSQHKQTELAQVENSNAVQQELAEALAKAEALAEEKAAHERKLLETLDILLAEKARADELQARFDSMTAEQRTTLAAMGTLDHQTQKQIAHNAEMRANIVLVPKAK